MSFRDWKYQPTDNGTMEEDMLVFFYSGISPWIQGFGYSWMYQESLIASKFVHLCYMIYTSKVNDILEIPEPKHRNYDEDRETFDLLVDTSEFIDFLEKWKSHSEIIGTPFDYLLKEFCYVWIDPSYGKPGSFTQRIFDAEDEADAEEEQYSGPDILSRKKWDLY